MSISEKLITTAANVPEVYESGQSSMVDESKLLPTTVSGNYISLDDVSEIPHKVECKISGVADLTSVQITRTGKNLATAQQVFADSGDYVETQEDGRNVVCFRSRIKALKTLPIFEKNTQYTFSFDTKSVLVEEAHAGRTDLVLRVIYTDGTNTSIYCGSNENWTKRTLVTTAGKTIQSVGHTSYGYFNHIYVDIDTFQVEKGSIATAYEPYNGQNLIPTSNGTIDAMTSTSPYMNIFTNTDDVNIEVTYRKSWGMQEEQTRFYNSLQQGTIIRSISFEWIKLSKESIASIINALSDTTTNQTVTFKKSSKEAAFTDTEWAELIATKPNWTFSLI